MTSSSEARVTVRIAAPRDAEGVAGIYNHYVAQTIVTFEEEPVEASEMSRRMEDVRAAGLPWLVAERGGAVVGYASARAWKPRRGYRFSTEVTVYVAPDQAGRGIGSLLYAGLLPDLEKRTSTPRWAGSPCPTKPASRSTRSSASGRWLTSSRWASSSTDGSTSATGSASSRRGEP